MCEARTFLLDNIYIRFGFKLYRQIVGIPMGTNCAILVADLFLFCYERDFMLSVSEITNLMLLKSRLEIPQKLTQLSPRSHSRHLVGKKTAQKDAIKDTTSDSQMNSCFPYRWSPASLTFNIYFYLFLY